MMDRTCICTVPTYLTPIYRVIYLLKHLFIHRVSSQREREAERYPSDGFDTLSVISHIFLLLSIFCCTLCRVGVGGDKRYVCKPPLHLSWCLLCRMYCALVSRPPGSSRPNSSSRIFTSSKYRCAPLLHCSTIGDINKPDRSVGPSASFWNLKQYFFLFLTAILSWTTNRLLRLQFSFFNIFHLSMMLPEYKSVNVEICFYGFQHFFYVLFLVRADRFRWL